MSTAPVVDPLSAIASVEQKLHDLEAFAIQHRLSGQSIPPLATRPTFANQRALHNALESTLVRIENIAATIPRVAATGRSHIQAKLIDYDPGKAFLAALLPPLTQLAQASVKIAALTDQFGPAAQIVHQQTQLLQASVKAEADLISHASKIAKPADPAVLKKQCEPLVDASADVAELKYDIDVRSPLHNHGMALGDVAAALGWVLAPAAVKHAKDYKAIVNTLAEDILSRYIDLGCNPAHSDFAEALRAILDALATYVEKEHPAGLRWNYAQGATPLGYRRAQRKLRKDSHPIADVYRLMHSGLTEFICVSRELGAPLKQISECTQGIYEEMANVIEVAAGKIKPQHGNEGELKMMLKSVQHEITPLIAILDKVTEEDRFYQHCVIFREFINAMQWCTATLQKMSPVGYIIDIESVTLLYVDKLEKDYASDDKYINRLHRAWAASVRKMLDELKEYVKLHHPNELMFDSRRTRKSVDGIIRSVSLTNQLKDLKIKSSSSKWKRGTTTRAIGRGARRSVNTWVKIS